METSRQLQQLPDWFVMCPNSPQAGVDRGGGMATWAMGHVGRGARARKLPSSREITQRMSRPYTHSVLYIVKSGYCISSRGAGWTEHRGCRFIIRLRSHCYVIEDGRESAGRDPRQRADTHGLSRPHRPRTTEPIPSMKAMKPAAPPICDRGGMRPTYRPPVVLEESVVWRSRSAKSPGAYCASQRRRHPCTRPCRR